MKKVISILAIISIVIALPLSVFASEGTTSSDENTYITYLDDGSYYITTVTESMARSTKSGTKTTTYYNSSDEALWKVTLKGSFTYTGTTSTCTSASHSVTIYNNAWYIYSQNSYASGNQAIANVVMKKKLLGIVTSTKNVNLTITCDKNGNLS